MPRSSPAGTVALEMLADAPEIDTLIVPIGGGGLVSGVGTATRALRPDIEIVGVQTEFYPSMYCRISGKDLPSAGDTIAEGIAVKKPGATTVGMILSGGNIDTRLLATVLLRDLARSGRMARLRIQLQDVPGALFSVVRL